MEGVTVLNIVTHVITAWGITVGTVVAWSVGAILIGLIIALAISLQEPSIIALIILPLFLFGGLGIVTGADGKEIGTYETYEVTIDNSVNFNEFAERYTIVDQHGQIYEVRLKDEG